MIKSNKVKALQREGKPAFGTWITLCPHPRVVKILASSGFDFVIIDEDRQVLALVELDDATHDRRRDAERDAITALAGYTTLRYESRDKPDVETLREDLLENCMPVVLKQRSQD